jgi:small nuclear ribonucleoprotein D3
MLRFVTSPNSGVGWLCCLKEPGIRTYPPLPPFVHLLAIHFAMSNVGIPIKLLFEAEGMKITVEMKSGEIYRGLLLGAEDTMNVSLSEVLRTSRTGQISKLANVYLRGSSVRFIALPDLLKSAPIFQKVASQKRKLEEAIAQKQGDGKKRKRS